ncbi:mechanosensitive ion channel family protein [Pseudoalteromonas rhizosphaerae]|uniref:mechanosensitive ion channel family protein n=1 Tax=Pseudoalteromonas rhizosphaerae TaxID=2518973 RepID=UPI0021493134|nr:mechanosensitive ion channel family protein [Pseudoalteromonas rhizosphaerae]
MDKYFITLLKLIGLSILFSLSFSLFAQPEITVKSLFDNENKEDSQSNPNSEVEQSLQATVITSAETGKEIDIDSLPYDEFHRITPSTTMRAYLRAVNQRDYALATNYLDYRNLPPEVKAIAPELLAEQLSLVFDRTLWIDIDTLSNKPEGKKNEPVPSYRDLVAEITTSRGPVQILLQRVPDEKGNNKVWKISNATVSNIPFLIDEFGYNVLGEWLYNNLPKTQLLGVMVWQWVYFIGSFFAFFLLAILITRIFAAILHRFIVQTPDDVLALIKGPICLLLAVLLSRSLYDISNVTITVVALAQGATVLLVAWTWVFLRCVDIIKHRLSDRFIEQKKPQAVFLLRPASNVLKTLVVIVAVLLWFENLGFNATTLLAGLGIGGLAIALAAQKTVENIIGAITLYISSPVKIGNLCKFGSSMGTIEEIGLRATRIRTLDRSVIYVANAKFVDMQLENISERERISYRPNLMLSAKTKQHDLLAFMAACKNLLDKHGKIDDTPCRVRFKGFTPWALQIDLLSYVVTTDFSEYMEIIEELNLAILGLLNEHNCQLANPEFARVSG